MRGLVVVVQRLISSTSALPVRPTPFSFFLFDTHCLEEDCESPLFYLAHLRSVPRYPFFFLLSRPVFLSGCLLFTLINHFSLKGDTIPHVHRRTSPHRPPPLKSDDLHESRLDRERRLLLERDST